MEEGAEAVSLTIQLGSAALLVVVMTLVHATGLAAISRLLGLANDRLEEQDFDVRAIARMAGMAALMFVLHLFEIWLFAAFYMLVGALGDLEEALYFSASTYSTLGRTEEFFPHDWRLLGSLESLIGFLLIGWSTAYIVSKVNKMRR